MPRDLPGAPADVRDHDLTETVCKATYYAALRNHRPDGLDFGTHWPPLLYEPDGRPRLQTGSHLEMARHCLAEMARCFGGHIVFDEAAGTWSCGKQPMAEAELVATACGFDGLTYKQSSGATGRVRIGADELYSIVRLARILAREGNTP
jgi:hypothetical protein